MSTPHTKRQEQAAARREQLLHIALRLFSEKGYRASSVRDIARAAGVNEGLLYHYFTGKADLFRAVLAQYAPFHALGEFLHASASAPAPLALDDALWAFGREFLARVREQRTFIVTILTEAPNDPELAALLSAFLLTARDEMTQFLAQYQRAGQIGAQVPIEAASRVLLGSLLVQFLADVLLAPSAPIQGDTALREVVTVLLSGLQPR